MGIQALPGVSGSDKISADRANSVVEGVFSAIGPGKAFSAWGAMNVVVYGALADALTTTAGSASASVASATGVAVGQAINSSHVPPGTTIKTLAGTDITLAFPPQYWTAHITEKSATVGMLGQGATATQPADLSTLVGATVVSPYFAVGTTVLSADQDAGTLTFSNEATATPKGGAALTEFTPDASVITETGADSAAFLTGATVQFNATFQLERSFDGGETWIVCNIGGGGSLAQYTTNTPFSISFGEAELGVLYRINVIAFSAVSNVTMNYRISATGQASTTLSVPVL